MRGRTSARIVLLLTVLGTGAFAFNVAWGSAEGLGASADACQTTNPPSPPRSPSASNSSSGGLPIPPLPLPTGASPSSSSGDPAPQPTPSGSSTASPQPGETESCESRINILYRREFNDQDPRNAFVGKVTSDRKNCESARSVVVKKKKSGADEIVGRSTTNANGRYRVFERRPRGSFYAKVRRSEATSGGVVVDCLGDRSTTIKVP